MLRSVAAGLALTVLASGGVVGQDWQSMSQARARSDETELRVDVEYGAGSLELRPAPAGMLYRTRMRYDADHFRPEVSYDDGRLGIEIGGGDIRGGKTKGGNLDLALGTELPLDLSLEFGAAEAQIELGGMRLTRGSIKTGASKTVLRVSEPNPQVCNSFEIEVGAAQFEAYSLGNLRTERFRLSGGVGEVVLDFGGAWETDMDANIEMGLGSLTLRVPRGLGLRVQKQGFLAGFDSEGLVKRGDVYFSENWEAANRRLTVRLQAALGSIRVVWVDA